MKEISEYDKKAMNFLEKTNTKFECKFLKNDKYFDDDKEKRDIYEITLTRGERVFKFNFGQSLANSGKWKIWSSDGLILTNDDKEANRHRARHEEVYRHKEFEEPTPYDVLACLEKNDVGSFENFCSVFGYDTDSKKVEKMYNTVLNEWNNVRILWTDEEIEQLQEIN